MSKEIVLNLSSRYAAAFATVGLGTLVFEKKQAGDTSYNFEYDTLIAQKFESTTLNFGNENLVFGTFLKSSESIFAPPLLLSFNRKKNLIETSVSGSDNVIIERWGTRPWEIEIKGLLIDIEHRHYPKDKVEKINQLFEHNDLLKVEGEQWEDKGIDSIYLKAVSINPVEGFQDTISLSIKAMSIKELSYNLIAPNQ